MKNKEVAEYIETLDTTKLVLLNIDYFNRILKAIDTLENIPDMSGNLIKVINILKGLD